MSDIGIHEQIRKNQQMLDRLSQVEIFREKARARFRHKEEDRGYNLIVSHAKLARREAQMRDSHRLGRIPMLNVKGKKKMAYSSDDLMRTNYQGMYER